MQDANTQHLTQEAHTASDVLMQHQLELEQLYNKNQLMPRIKHEFTSCKEIDFTKVFTDNGIPIDFGYAVLVQMALHKRAPFATIVGILRGHCQQAQEVVTHLSKMMALGLVIWNPIQKYLITAITIDDDVQAELDRFQFPLPMVVEPREVRSNRDTGYLLNRGSIILKKNHHDNDVCLDHINRMNKVKFTINVDTATMIQNTWRNLDKPKEGETKEDFDRRKRAFEKYDRTCHDVITVLTQHGNEFYLTHKYDKRGRSYCQGYHVNYQGAPWNKAVIELAQPEVIEI